MTDTGRQNRNVKEVAVKDEDSKSDGLMRKSSRQRDKRALMKSIKKKMQHIKTKFEELEKDQDVDREYLDKLLGASEIINLNVSNNMGKIRDVSASKQGAPSLSKQSPSLLKQSPSLLKQSLFKQTKQDSSPFKETKQSPTKTSNSCIIKSNEIPKIAPKKSLTTSYIKSNEVQKIRKSTLKTRQKKTKNRQQTFYLFAATVMCGICIALAILKSSYH